MAQQQNHPAESTPLLSKTTIGTGSFNHTTTGDDEDGEGGGGYARLSFRRKSYAKLSVRQLSSVLLSPDNDEEDNNNNNATTAAANTEGAVAVVVPLEGLAPLFHHTGIQPYAGREYIPYRKPSLVKSVPAFPPYRRKARHRSFYLWWTNEFRHWVSLSFVVVCLLFVVLLLFISNCMIRCQILIILLLIFIYIIYLHIYNSGKAHVSWYV